MSSARTALRERVAALAQARRALDAGRLGDAERILREELSRWPGNRDAQSLLAETIRRQGGTPGRIVPAAAPAPSRGSGSPEAWSSFEARVRDRKVARLGERARTALRSGAVTEALALSDEIEAIAPGHPILAELSVPPRPDHAAPVTPAPAPEPPIWREEPIPAADLRAPAAPAYTLATDDLRIDGSNALDVSLRPLDLHGIDPAPTTIADRESSSRLDAAPIRERGTLALGMFLLVASVLALSGIVGYWWFTPATGGAPVVERTARQASDTPAGSERQAGVPVGAGATTPEPSSQQDPTRSSSNTGTADGGAPTIGAPDPSSQGPSPLAKPAPAKPVAPAPTPATAPTPVDPPATLGSRSEVPRESTVREAPDSANGQPGATTARVDPPPTNPAGTSEPQVSSPAAPPATSAAPPDVVSPAPPVSLPGAASGTAAPRPSPPVTEAPARAADSNAPDDTPSEDASAMRGLIEGYLAGYNNLDAGGVRSVWPAVDHRALARAFGQLASQRLVFSRCEVRGENDEGHGFCIGRATWRPRVGGGERNERRVWRFDFEQRNGRWAIDGVDIER